MHCAVLAIPSDTSNELLEYLIEAAPESIQKKNSNGETPLLVACRLGRIDYVRILIDGNADQSVRNHKGENILHAAVAGNPKADKLRLMLDLFDADLRSHLFLQRKNFNENGNTPLHAWVSQASGVQPENTNRYRYNNYYNNGSSNKPYGKDTDVVDMAKLLLEYSKGEELEMLNGAGETCLHTAIMHGMLSLTQVLVNFQPKLLYRENAVGRTPAELAHDRLTGDRFAKPDRLSIDKHVKVQTLMSTSPGDFVTKATLKNKSSEEKAEMLANVGLSGDYSAKEILQIMGSMGVSKEYEDNSLNDKAKKQVMWDLCLTTMQRNPLNRRLVSLNEANDVAKRLGEKYSASRYFSIQARAEDEDGEEGEEKEAKEASDFATNELTSRMGGAWSYFGDDEKKNKSSEGGNWCSGCGQYH
jgi:ankyrin repeat protein